MKYLKFKHKSFSFVNEIKPMDSITKEELWKKAKDSKITRKDLNIQPSNAKELTQGFLYG